MILAQKRYVHEIQDSAEMLYSCDLYDKFEYDTCDHLDSEIVLNSPAAGRDMQISEYDS